MLRTLGEPAVPLSDAHAVSPECDCAAAAVGAASAAGDGAGGALGTGEAHEAVETS